MTWMLFFIVTGITPQRPPVPGYETRSACEQAARPEANVRTMCLPIAAR